LKSKVGFAGGKAPKPTYRSMKDHTEAVMLEFDPKIVSFAHLVELFWSAHDPSRPGWGVQYAHKIWYRNEEQKAIVMASKEKLERNGTSVKTFVVPFTTWTDAEDYHQKYTLRHHSNIIKMLRYKDKDIIESHYAMRLNSWLARYGEVSQLDEIDGWDLKESVKQDIKKFCREIMEGKGRRNILCGI